jgi:hypothetical protein
MLYRVYLAMNEFDLITLLVIGTYDHGDPLLFAIEAHLERMYMDVNEHERLSIITLVRH